MVNHLYRYNKHFLPLHLLLWGAMALGYYMSTEKNDWLESAIMGSFVFNTVGSIPMLIHFFKKIKQFSLLSYS
ncbi:hypothetical protein [Neobacillus sp. YIM B06451]|uniref:hypothetical protein n=1 Tax=Neobacillus sp. YIM B06451 TaxID=3070994 RepID=UPI00292DAF31|nr:hypothetical protein [Neobacillus sp. YIM B06451]